MINKEGWEIKRLSEFSIITMGQSPSSESYNDLEGLPFFQGNADFGKLHPKARVFCTRPTKLAEKDDILISVRAPIGAVNISDVKCCIGRGLASIRSINKISTNKFIYYLLISATEKLNRLGTGSTFKAISKDSLSKLDCNYYPLPIQQQIVSELDTLSEIIAKKKQQLAELDNLAQATFYDMFGDPVRNEKGWDKDSIVNVAPVKSFKGDVESFEGKYWLLNLDMIESNSGNVISVNLVEEKEIGNSTVVFSEENVLYSKLRPYLNKVIIPFSSGYATSELLPLLPKKDVLDKTFLAQLLRSKFFVGYIQEKVAGAKMPRVSMDIFRAFQIILPPLTLQTQFAEKVNAIEKQKELIQKTIDDAQLLFDYTMDKYFND